jgi:hypothetical protein
VLPLAALRPFEKRTPAVTKASVTPPSASPATTAKPAGIVRNISDNACDSAMAAPDKRSANHVHADSDDSNDGYQVIEFMSTRENSCAQAAIIGRTTFSNDRLIALGDSSYVTLREITLSVDRSLRITRRENGTMDFASRLNGRPVPFDDSMREWLSRFMPEVLTEAGIGVPARVARDVARGGVDAALDRIGRITSPSSKRLHYEALLDERPLTEKEYERISKHATRTLANAPSDLGAVLTRVAAGPAAGTKVLQRAVSRLMQAQSRLATALATALDEKRSSKDSANTLTQYGVSDDADMLLLALKGARDISSDGDKRVLLQTVAAGALRRKSEALRTAFFDAAETMTSDSDLRVVLTTALPYGHADHFVTSEVFRLVKERMSSDSERRVVLVTAAEQRLISTASLRDEFMAAAKAISSSTDYRVVMQAALKQ